MAKVKVTNGDVPLPTGTVIDGIDCSGMTDDPKKSDVPVYLQRQNVKESAEARKNAEEAKKKQATETAFDPAKWDKPKGMSEEEYTAWKNRDRQKEEAKAEATKKSRQANIKKAQAARGSKEAPADTFHLPKSVEGVEAKVVRRIARDNKDKLKPLETATKYYYPNKEKDRIIAIIRAGLSAPTKKKATTKKIDKPTPTLPPPSETVWSGKAKVKRTKTAPPKPSPTKAEKSKVLAKATKKATKKKKSAFKQAEDDINNILGNLMGAKK
jgi:hypothetical protein